MNRLDLLYGALAIVTAPWWARRARSGWRERFGGTPPLPPPARPRLLLHAVSVGEVGALRTLVPLLRPHVEVVVSATTDTGIARARELFGSGGAVVRYPLDFSGSVRRFLDAVRPDAVALVELELWPNFVRECARRAIPACIINGRLSERSFRGYRRLRPWMKRTFGALEFVAVQDHEYRARFEAMGVSHTVCRVTGSMKWDAAKIEDTVAGAAELRELLRIDPSRPLVVAGSTGPGEEELLDRVMPEGAQLVCAPRRPERFDEVARLLEGCVRRSCPAQGDPASGRFLLDSIGELRCAYALADVVVVGRSFGALFGSDPIEPAALGKPVVIGPSYGDFATIVRALRDAGGIVIADREALGGTLSVLLEHPAERARLAANARACVRSHQGVSQRHADLLRTLVEGSPSARGRAAASTISQGSRA